MDEPPGGGGGQLLHSVETGGSSHVSLIESSPRLMQAKSMKCSPCGGSHVCMSTSALNMKQYIPPRLHGVINQKIITCIFIVMKTSIII
jgi:hypothetical protein